MSDKLLHERMREAGCGCVKVIDVVGFSCDDMECCNDCYGILANAISDEIERYYIPRPRYEDGEPVEAGSRAAGLEGPVESISIHFDEYGAPWYNLLDGVDTVGGTGPFERKAAALDADGVEVGDTVWNKETGRRYTVVDCVAVGLRQTIKVKNEMGAFNYFDPPMLTHQEPDSFEKLRDYVEECRQQEYGSARDAYREIADRLTALMERGA